jgi:hypothetical protein
VNKGYGQKVAELVSKKKGKKVRAAEKGCIMHVGNSLVLGILSGSLDALFLAALCWALDALFLAALCWAWQLFRLGSCLGLAAV